MTKTVKNVRQENDELAERNRLLASELQAYKSQTLESVADDL